MSRSRNYWEERAADVRASAERMQTAANKWAMMRISQVYTRLAARAPEQDDDNNEPEPQGTAGKRRG